MKYATIVVSLLIIVAVLIPGRDLPDINIGGYDKLVHLLMFATWGIAVRFDFDRTPFQYGLFFLLGITFSALSELLQILVEGRSVDAYDLLADAVGLIIGLTISGRVVKWVNGLLGR